jgi:hypothetical protein
MASVTVENWPGGSIAEAYSNTSTLPNYSN